MKTFQVPLIPDVICHEKSHYNQYKQGPPGKTNTLKKQQNAPDWTGTINSSKQTLWGMQDIIVDESALVPLLTLSLQLYIHAVQN